MLLLVGVWKRSRVGWSNEHEDEETKVRVDMRARHFTNTVKSVTESIESKAIYKFNRIQSHSQRCQRCQRCQKCQSQSVQLGLVPSPLRHSEYEPSLASDTWSPQQFSREPGIPSRCRRCPSRLWGLKQAISASPKANTNRFTKVQLYKSKLIKVPSKIIQHLHQHINFLCNLCIL